MPAATAARRHALLLAALFVLPPPAAALEGLVIHVADGDTLTVMDDGLQRHRVRIAGIDAPERGQPFGSRAREALSDLTRNRRVAVEGGKTDRYRRRVGMVTVLPQDCRDCAPGIDVGLAMVNAGLAWHYRAYERGQTGTERSRYRKAEAEARAGGRGLWTENTPVPPWDWRQSRRPAGKKSH